jgi:hypothetical protein
MTEARIRVAKEAMDGSMYEITAVISPDEGVPSLTHGDLQDVIDTLEATLEAKIKLTEGRYEASLEDEDDDAEGKLDT